PVLETLSDRLQSALADVRSRGKLTEDDVAKAMRQVRLALLEADVNFQVVKEFTGRVGERAQGADVLQALNPGQQVVKLVGEELMEELARIRKRIKPHDVLLVVDAMTGQDAVNVAERFAESAEFDGVVLTKLDGDARGGAALSVKAVTGKPILYASTGEKLDAFERFHPDRMAQRILGMGDVLTLVEKAERQMDERKAAELERKIRKQQFTLD